MTYADLPDLHAERRPPVLFCEVCLEPFSAHKGDYFWAEPDEEIRCGRCETPLVLAKFSTVMEVVRE